MEKAFDFCSARRRVEELTAMYRSMARTHPKDGTWDWWIPTEINALEMEIAEAHAARKGKMTALADGHPVMHLSNIITPMVPQWRSSGKGAGA